LTAEGAYLGADAGVDPRFSSVDCVFFVIGAQKAGTTWLSHYLKAHPNVSVPEWKEHDYWNMVEGRPNPSRMLAAQKKRREAQSVWRTLGAAMTFTLHARRQKAITLALKAAEAPYAPYSAYADVILENCDERTRAAGEICPEYAVLRPETFERMAALQPNVRFIFLMRDPVARFVSGVRHGMRKSGIAGTEDALSEAISASVADPHSRSAVLSRYDMTIRNLDDGVPDDRVLYVFFESMFDQSAVRKICDFLGLPFVEGNIGDRANSAGKNKARVRPEDRAAIARALAPVYDFVLDRFGGDVPARWRESAVLA
jgi:hypothetical protein